MKRYTLIAAFVAASLFTFTSPAALAQDAPEVLAAACGIQAGQPASSDQLACVVKATLIRAEVARAAAAPALTPVVPAPAPATPTVGTVAGVDIPKVDPSTVPDAEADPLGFLRIVIAALAAKQWLMLIPFVLLGAIAGIRKFGSKWLGGFFTTPRGGAVLALLGALAGSLYLTFKLGLTGLVPILVTMAGIFVTAYPWFKLAGNVITGAPSADNGGSGGGLPAPAVVPPGPTAEALAAATAKVEAARAAEGKSATELDAELRAPVKLS